MYKLSPRRNHRSKGIKVKHVLQVCLLLVVCFWLIYQVKHSHDKKKEFDENDVELSIKSESSSKLVKHGRKDLQTRIEGVTTINEKHREEPEDGGKKAEDEDQVIGKTEDKNDEHREDEEDEVDDQEKFDVEVDREEDFVDEVKGRDEDDERGAEERDSEDDDGQVEDENSLEDHDHDENSRSSHEAREENYKADDASSAVSHDTKLITSGSENGNLKETTAHTEVDALEGENSSNNDKQLNAGQNSTGLKVVDIEEDGKGSSLNATNSEEKSAKNISSNSLDTLPLNSTRTEGLTNNSGLTDHLMKLSIGTRELSPQNRKSISKDHNVTVEETNTRSFNLSTTSLQQSSNSADMVENNHTDSNLTLYTKTEGLNSTRVDSSNVSANIQSSLVEKSVQGNASVGAVDNMRLPNSNATEGEKSYSSDETGTTDEGQDISNPENLVQVQNDPIVTIDSSTNLEEKHVRTELETLPKVQTKGSNSNAAAAE